MRSGKVIISSLKGPDYYDMMRMFVWVMIVSRMPIGESAEPYSKKPIDYDGSIEFYFLMTIGGIALLGVWELLKWMAHRYFGEDETTVNKAKRLLKIRNQASRALQEELASMTSSSSSDPMFVEPEKKTVTTPRMASTARETTPMSTRTPTTTTAQPSSVPTRDKYEDR